MPDSLNVPFRQFPTWATAIEHAELAGYVIFQTKTTSTVTRHTKFFAFSKDASFELARFDDGRCDWRPLEKVRAAATGGWLRYDENGLPL